MRNIPKPKGASRGYRNPRPHHLGNTIVLVYGLRGDPVPIAALTVAGTMEHLEGIIGELTGPASHGHSFGGIWQLLLDRGYGDAGGRSTRCRPRVGLRGWG